MASSPKSGGTGSRVSLASLRETTKLGEVAGPAGDPRLEQSVGQWSQTWAKVVKPFTWFIFCLLATAMAVPFLLISALPVGEGVDRLGKIVEWAHTILPPLVGFGGAVVGYYFGTRGDQPDGSGRNPPG